jgi:hypothetical protein
MMRIASKGMDALEQLNLETDGNDLVVQLAYKQTERRTRSTGLVIQTPMPYFDIVIYLDMLVIR